MDRTRWQALTPEETAWWDTWLRTKGDQWPDDFARRIDAAQPLPPLIEELLAESGTPNGSRLRILDLGSGPLTNVGARSERYEVEVVPVDPLADEYNRLIDKYGIVAPNPTSAAEAERLDHRFPPHSFDLVWACNSLDHSHDPVLGLYQAFQVLKPGGHLILTFHRNEADHGGYEGLHNWNFDMRNGAFVIESRGRLVDMSAKLRPCTKLRVLFKQPAKTFKSRVTLDFEKQSDLSIFDLVAT
jgi:SAM-dependent methyltransferase